VPRHPFLLAAIALAAAVAFPVAAQTDHSKHMTAQRAQATPVMTDGVVKRVDAARGEVTIAHDDIKNLDMPKMTMAFKVRDPAWLKKIKAGDAIRFAADMPGGELTVVAYEIVR
jgi:Cu(I)/Ag(I) efflux system periplasmic protein CusF